MSLRGVAGRVGAVLVLALAAAGCGSGGAFTGRGAGTTPVGNPTTTVRPSFGPRRVVKAAVEPSAWLLGPHDRVEPKGPA